MIRSATATLFVSLAPAVSGAETLAPHRFSQVMAGGFGDITNNWLMNSAHVWGDEMYWGTGGAAILPGNGGANPPQGASIYKSVDGLVFESSATNGIGGDPWTQFAVSLYADGGYLYAGFLNAITGGHLYRTADGVAWETIAEDGFGDVKNAAMTSIAAFGGYLYVGTWNLCCGTQLWRSADGVAWEVVQDDGYGEGVDNSDTAKLFVHDGHLYAIVENWTYGMRVLRSSNGTDFEKIVDDGFGNLHNSNAPSIVVYKGDLYVGTWNNLGAELHRAPLPGDAGTWELVASTETFPFSYQIHLIPHGEYFVAATMQGGGGSVYRSFDGTAWEAVMTGGFGSTYTQGTPTQLVFQDRLYLGTYSDEDVPNPLGAAIWRADLPQNDLDADGVPIGSDNCPASFNPAQSDGDADGVGAACDCDDADAARPAPEVCDDGVDNDCDGEVDTHCDACLDADADGFSPQGGLCGPVDCDDADAAVYPGATDPCNGDGVDGDCDGYDGEDADGDGYGSCGLDCAVFWRCAPDCDNADPFVHPAAMEIPENGIDDDCDPDTPAPPGCGPTPPQIAAAAGAEASIPVDRWIDLLPYVAAAALFVRQRRGGPPAPIEAAGRLG